MRATLLATITLVATSARAHADPAPPSPAPPADQARPAEPPAPAAPAASPSPAPAEAPGELIVVTALRIPRVLAQVPATVIVVDRDALERAPAVLADDVLRAVPSLATFRRSSSLVADPTAQGLALRGVGPSGVSRALVLADGIPQNDPFGGWVYWRAVPLLAVDRVEIVPGGSSALFGNFGLGGVMQLVSRPIEDDRLEAALAGGSLDTGRAAARATTRAAGLGIELDGEAFHSDGYTPVAASERGAADHAASSDHGSAGARIERGAGDSRVTAFGRWFDESLDAGTDHTTADVRTVSYGATAALAGAPGVLALTAFGSDQLFRQERARVAPGRASATTASTQRTPSNSEGGSVTLTSRPLATRHVLLVGADALRVAGTATDTFSPVMPTDSALATRAAGGEQQFAGLFAQDAIHASDALELSAAIRLDAWRDVAGHQTLTTVGGTRTDTPVDDRHATQLDPRLGALVHLDDQLALGGSISRAFRAPTLNELYRAFQVGTVLTDANPMLRPESAWSAELGPQLATPELTARAVAFWTHLDAPIDNVTLAAPLADGAQRQRQNLGAARVTGLELEATFHPTARWRAGVAYTFAQATVISAPAQPALAGKHLAQDPRGRATAELTFDDPALATITAQGRYTSSQFEDDQNTLPMGAFCVLDVMAARRIGRGFGAFVTVENLLDAHYLVGRAGVDTVGAPRTIQIGVRFDSARWGGPRGAR